jgi:hypothetical protein
MSCLDPLRWRRTWPKHFERRLWAWLTFGLTSMLLTTAVVNPSAADVHSAANPQHTDSAKAADANTAADRVPIGAEYLSRRTDLPNKLIVAARQNFELPEEATYDYIEVAGTLRVSRAHDTSLKFTHLVILPGGYLDAGTQADPIPCQRKVDFIVRDVPIDTTKDPYQWGNGLVNFGRQTRVGCSKTAWVEAVGTIASGSSAITLASAPSGWQVGDELLIPDTSAPAPKPRREAKVTIAALDSASLTLSKPLDFAHETINDPNGVVVLRPRVANLTRNIVIRSENPSGTRGHTADVGHMATWDIRYNRLIGLGRTGLTPLNDTVLPNHIGTNQRGKYAEHHHHALSVPTSADVGNVYIGDPAIKWGLVVHGTSDSLVERNVAIDFPGAGFITEDGYEVRNVFRNNLAAYSIGNAVESQGNVTLGCPGCEGTGFWFRGVMNTFEGNEAWNNLTGMNLLNQQQPPGQYPSAAGGKPDTKVNHYIAKPVLMTRNVLAANIRTGLEAWATPGFPNESLVAAYNKDMQVFGVISEGIQLLLRSPRVICRVGTGSIGVHSALAYIGSFEIDNGGYIGGCAIGIARGGGASFMRVTGTTLQNEVNVDLLTQYSTFTNVLHVPLGNFPHQYIVFGNGAIWNGTDPLPKVGSSVYFPQRGSSVVVKNWQGTGQDYLLFYRQQLGSNPSWYSAGAQHGYNTPVPGLTMQQSWERYGLAYGGDVLKESEAVQLDGLVNGLARKGLSVAFPPPRAIVTFPTPREPALVANGTVFVSALLTGDPNVASSVMMLSVDGDPPVALDKAGTDDRSFTTTHVSPGVHEVRVWRTQKAKPSVPIAGSEYIARYCVGSCETTAPSKQ